MRIKSTTPLFAAITACAMLAACSTVSVGSRPSDTPPKLVAEKGEGDKQVFVWDDPSKFGPVPAELAAKGQAVCSTLDTPEVKAKAVGYHPQAQDANGNAFVGGGYFCAKE